MNYVYLLRSAKTDALYVGSTRDLRRRFSEHNAGKSSSTRNGRPWCLIYYEAYILEQDAREREHQLKRHAQAMVHLKKRLHTTLQSSK